MLDYNCQRAADVLRMARTAVLATSGPAGVQASEVLCEAIGLDLYLLLPETSDHLFNLETDPSVTMLAAGWELKGRAQVISPNGPDLKLSLLQEQQAQWCMLVRVKPFQVHVRRGEGWGLLETIDLDSP